MGDIFDHAYRMKNPIQYYAWGSKTAIARLVGRPFPSPKPEAELWMGAHPKAPSIIFCEEGEVNLDDLVARYPEEILGQEVAQRFDSQLPFLFKILAADSPLSIQAHPDLEQARIGYDRENRAGIPLTAPERNYRDANHKPEVICALTDFWGLNGFRSLNDLHRQLNRWCPETLGTFFNTLRQSASDNVLQKLLEHILSLQGREKKRALAETITQAQKQDATDDIPQWILKLERAYPGDIGILAPVILNLIRLQPDQAMYLPAGQLHAYLEGVGIELMANSDNVLRGGLTPKHVDREELMHVLRFEPCKPDIKRAQSISITEARFLTPASEFSLTKISVSPKAKHTSPFNRNVEVLLVTEGEALLTVGPNEEGLQLARGESVLIPAAAGAYHLSGQADIYRATVP